MAMWDRQIGICADSAFQMEPITGEVERENRGTMGRKMENSSIKKAGVKTRPSMTE